MAPTHCTNYEYYFDKTSSGVLGAAYDQFTIDFAKGARTITIASSSTWEEAEKKTYSIPITIKWGDSKTLLSPAVTWTYQLKVQADACEAVSPTQVMATASETKTVSYNLGETNKDIDYTVVWNPV